MRLLKMDGQDSAPASNESQNQQVVPVGTPEAKTPRTPRKLKVNIDKNIPELQKQDAAPKDVVEVETAKRPIEKVSSQETNDTQDDSSEPEIKKRKKGRASMSEKKKDVPVKQRSSSRSTKGKHSKTTADILATDALLSQVNVKVQKPSTQSQKIYSCDEIFELLTSSADEMPLNSRLSGMRKKVLVKPTTASGSNPAKSSSSIFKQPLTTAVNQKTSQKHNNPKRTMSTEEVCKELVDKCDKQVPVLFPMMVKEFDAEQILKGYKSEVKPKVQAQNLTPAKNVVASTLKKPATLTPGTARKRIGSEGRTASLQRILLELPNLCDPNVFPDILMKTYASRLEASKVFEFLPSSDLKEAIVKKFTPSELMALVQKNDSAGKQFLAMASAEAILQEVQSREELRNSGKLLGTLLQNFGGTLSIESKKALKNENVIETVLDFASVDAIVKKVKGRPDLKNFEELLNVLLENLPEKISDETKKSVIKVLNEKFNTGELVDISHAAIKMSVDKYQKQ